MPSRDAPPDHIVEGRIPFMPRFSRVRHAPARTAAVLALALLVVAGAGGADGGSGLAPEFEPVARQARAFAGRAVCDPQSVLRPA